MFRLSGNGRRRERREITHVGLLITKEYYRTWNFQYSGFCNYFSVLLPNFAKSLGRLAFYC